MLTFAFSDSESVSFGVRDDTEYDGQHAWSAHGAWLVFISGRSGFDAVYVIRVEGGEARRLTEDPSLDPSWSP